jgi:ribonuclease inhibitor
MRKKIYLDADRLKNRKDMHDYLGEAFDFPFWFGYNLDALYDCLSEMDDVEVEIQNLANDNKYAALCLKVMRTAGVKVVEV